MHRRKEEAARAGSRGGEGSNQHSYDNTTDAMAQSRCTSMPGRRGSAEQLVVQLLIFDIAGAAAEPYTPVRARRMAKTAVRGGGRADR